MQKWIKRHFSLKTALETYPMSGIIGRFGKLNHATFAILLEEEFFICGKAKIRKAS
jgi:hypothetical protein